jgi:hypothetical protein
MENTMTFGQALSAAQAEFPPIEKDKENPHFKSRYSSLDAIVSATRPALHKHGLFVYHEVSVIEYKLTVVAVLELAATGERRTNAAVIDVTPNVQQIGSAITYLRRYTLAPLLGVCSDEDDDGNAQATAPAKPRQQQRPQQQKTPPKPELTEDEATFVNDMAARIAAAMSSDELDALSADVAEMAAKHPNITPWLAPLGKARRAVLATQEQPT